MGLPRWHYCTASRKKKNSGGARWRSEKKRQTHKRTPREESCSDLRMAASSAVPSLEEK